jgi:hypothetical protein
MRGNTTTIFDVNDPEKSKRDFTFDFSYWSHDAFHIDANGVAVPDSDRYADQKRVFLDLGQGVLKNAFGGIFAMVCVLFDILKDSTRRCLHMARRGRARSLGAHSWSALMSGSRTRWWATATTKASCP